MVNSSIDKHLTSWVVLLLVLSVSFSASGESLVVSKQGDEFHSIQKAIDKASTGDVVHVEEGTYRENLNLDEGITIKGKGPEKVKIISKNKKEPVVLAGPSSAEIKLAGVAIKESTGSKVSKCNDIDKGVCPVGLSVTGGVSISVVNARITGNAGILLQGSSGLSLVNSLVANNGGKLKGDSNIFYAGIELRNSSQANLKDVELIENHIGLLLIHSATAEIKKCRVSGSSQEGVWVANQAEALFEESKFHNNEVGIHGFGGEIKLVGSKISENNLGVEFIATKASMENVSIKRNRVGGVLRAVSKVRLKNSTIKTNGKTGLKVFNSKANLYNTEFVKNGFYGLQLFEGSASLVKNSRFENNESAGILLQKTSKARVASSSFKENGKAIQMAGSSRLELKKAKITNNDTGIEISIPDNFGGSLSGYGNIIYDNDKKFSGVSESKQNNLVAEKE